MEKTSPSSESDLSLVNQAGEVGEGAIVGAFGVSWENASGQLSAPEVVADAVTADSFSGTGLVGAVAPGHDGFLFAIHMSFLTGGFPGLVAHAIWGGRPDQQHRPPLYSGLAGICDGHRNDRSLPLGRCGLGPANLLQSSQSRDLVIG